VVLTFHPVTAPSVWHAI